MTFFLLKFTKVLQTSVKKQAPTKDQHKSMKIKNDNKTLD